MDNMATKKGIIPRVSAGPTGMMLKDSTRVFSQIWQGSKEVIAALEALKEELTSPEEVVELFFEGGSEDPVLWCFVILISRNHEDVLVLFSDLLNHEFGSIEEAHDWFFTNVYAKQKTCSGRSYGRHKPRTAA